MFQRNISLIILNGSEEEVSFVVFAVSSNGGHL